MRPTTLALVSSLSLLLVGCGGETSDGDSPSPTAEEAAQEPAEGTAAVDDSEDDSEDAEAESAEAAADEGDEGGESEELEPSEEDPTRDTSESERSPRGNLPKDLGQTASIATDGGEGDLLLEFRVTDITVDGECTGEYPQDPQNGKFLIVTLEAETYPELGEQEYVNSWDFNPYDFQIIGQDGTRENDSVGTAYSCLSESDALPMSIGPGQKVTGKVALDTAYESGYLVYVPGLLEAGWEWQFGGQ